MQQKGVSFGGKIKYNENAKGNEITKRVRQISVLGK